MGALRVFVTLLYLSILILHCVPPAAARVNPQTDPPPPQPTPPARTPLIMLSTMDGTVSAFDANTGTPLFTHHDPRPAVDSWAAPGSPEYVPSLDGMLYRIDRATDEAHLVDGKFINRRADSFDEVSPADPAAAADSADAMILTAEESSVMYVDLRTGRVIKELKFADVPKKPFLKGISDNIIVVSRTSVGVRVVEARTGKDLANATLVHTVPSFLDHGRCATQSDAFVAHVTDSRDRVTVKSLLTGDVVWTKKLAAPVVEAHGLGGVRIVGSRVDEELAGRGGTAALPDSSNMQALPTGIRDVVVAEGKYVYAMPAAPNKEDTLEIGDGTDDAKPTGIRRYTVANVKDFSALSRNDRVLGRGTWPTRNRPPVSTDVTFVVTSRDAGLAGIAMIVVGLVGYVVGSRPRSRDKSRSKKKVKRRRRTQNVDDSSITERPDNHRREGDEDGDETSSGLEDDDTREGEKRTVHQRGFPNGSGSDKSGSDQMLETSNGSTGSGGGYVSNRSQSGWMSVGCLQISSKVLGVGSHGTVVYEGKMMPGERKVAVKRLLRQFFESARKEISFLVELDEASPHVVRYFAMEEDSEFIYLALELCSGSLAERVTERSPPVPSSAYTGGPPPAHTSRALRQLLQGLADLHRVAIVHRDVKPQNILITRSSNGIGDIKLADVGLALRLAANRSSYTAVTNAGGGVGTTGWRAPEVLGGERQTKAVDIFAAGCVVCFVLTGGQHPFGNPIFGRDGNIAAGNPSLEPLEALNLPEATDIVTKMIDPVSANRPSADEALRHPFFWTDAAKLSFLVDISDRLYDLRYDNVRYTENLDRYSVARAHCSDWLVLMDMELIMGLGRGYENTASGVLRVIRNKRNHYSELSAKLQKLLGPLPEEKSRSDQSRSRPNISFDSEPASEEGANFLTYFTSRVPHLLMCVYQYALENPALIAQPHFSRYGLNVDGGNEVALHPFVQKARSSGGDPVSRSRFPSLPEQRDGVFVGNRFGEGLLPDGDDDDDEVVVTTSSGRRTYHRHELVEIQQHCETMPLEMKRRAVQSDIYSSSAYARYRKRLTSNLFEESDFPPEQKPGSSTTEVFNVDVPPGFQQIPPRRNSQQQGAVGLGPRSVFGTSPGSNRPPVYSGSGTGRGGGRGLPYNIRRTNGGNNKGQAPTVSQFSGEERVADFSALRRRKL